MGATDQLALEEGYWMFVLNSLTIQRVNLSILEANHLLILVCQTMIIIQVLSWKQESYLNTHLLCSNPLLDHWDWTRLVFKNIIMIIEVKYTFRELLKSTRVVNWMTITMVQREKHPVEMCLCWAFSRNFTWNNIILFLLQMKWT